MAPWGDNGNPRFLYPGNRELYELSLTVFSATSKLHSFTRHTTRMDVSVNDVKIAGYVAPTITGVATLIRLGERMRTRKYGLDDVFASVSFLILVAFIIALFIDLGDITHLSRLHRYSMYYLIAQSFYGVIWTSRLSLLFTIIRASPEGSVLRRVLHAAAVTFITLWVVLAGQIFWVCEKNGAWKDLPTPRCPLNGQVPIVQLASDIYADAVLIIAPLRLLWNLKSLDGSHWRRTSLLVMFSASIVTSITSLVHSYYILIRPGSLDVILAAMMELCSSLFTCNLPVLGGSFVRFLYARRPWHTGTSCRPNSDAYELFIGLGSDIRPSRTDSPTDSPNPRPIPICRDNTERPHGVTMVTMKFNVPGSIDTAGNYTVDSEAGGRNWTRSNHQPEDS